MTCIATHLRRAAAALIIVSGTWLLSNGQARAENGVYIHIVRPGETLASISQLFYGDTAYEKVLVAANGLASPVSSAIVVGMPLMIPYTHHHSVEQGDTWARLAERYLGEAGRAGGLVATNNASPENNPEVGSQVLIPFLMRYVADHRDDLNRIAIRFFGSKNAVNTLRRFNKLTLNRLQRGQVVLVPLTDLKLSSEGKSLIDKQTGSKFSGTDVKTLQEQIGKQLPKLQEQVRKGYYLDALAQGHEMLGSQSLTVSQRLVVYKELATVYVAMDRPNKALELFIKALRIRPDLEIDTAKTSPKVLAVLNKARKQVSKR